MAIYPGANVRLLNPRYLSGRKIPVHNRVNLHVAAGTGSLFNYFNAPGRASSHFWVAFGGVVEQYVDTTYQAEADLEGNDATISVETEGGLGPSPDTDPWTDAQVAAIAGLVRWAMDTHNIPRVLATSSRTDASSRGLSWHRLGIDGNFPALPDIRAGRRQRGGGMRYSSALGKICPGGGKIQQIPSILDLVNGIVPPIPPVPDGGGGGSTPDGGGPPPPPAQRVVVDGQWGPATTRELQRDYGTTVDGIISHQFRQNGINYPGLFSAQWDKTLIGSNLIRAIQGVLGIKTDGLCGRDTISAMQRRVGTTVDGALSTPHSNLVAEMQRRLNAGVAVF